MDPLNKSTLGTSGVAVTALGLGTVGLGGWPTPVTETDAVAIVQAAWDIGLRYFDTAPLYGWGKSERFVGKVLREQPRSSFAVSTKVGRLLVDTYSGPGPFQGEHQQSIGFDFSYEGTRRSLEGSLERLGLDRVDVALIHDPDDALGEALDGTYRALDDMRSEGTVGAIGVGTNWIDPLVYLATRAEFDCMLVAGRYTILEQEALDVLLPLALEKQVSIIVGGVFNSGVIVDPSAGSTYNYEEAPQDILTKVRRIHEICAVHRVDPRAAAVQFPLAHPAIATVLTGARLAGEIEASAQLMAEPIPAGLWEDLVEASLIRRDAPLPRS